MLVQDFREACFQYSNFEIWKVESMAAFFNGSEVLPLAFEQLFQMPLSEFQERRSEIARTDMEIMEHILDHIGDKHFLIFTYHSPNHGILVDLQDKGVMNFGLDINDVRQDCVYICIMDKAPGDGATAKPER